jgi:hypothetical protein
MQLRARTQSVLGYLIGRLRIRMKIPSFRIAVDEAEIVDLKSRPEASRRPAAVDPPMIWKHSLGIQIVFIQLFPLQMGLADSEEENRPPPLGSNAL